MSAETARAQGLFIPNWWLAILLVPLACGVIWVVITLTAISTNQQAMKDTLEYRLKEVEIRAKLNDEHNRILEKDIARTQGRLDEIQKKQQQQ